MPFPPDLTDLLRLHSEMNRVFESMRSSFYGEGGQDTAMSPALDLRESDSEWVLQVDLAGVPPDCIQVETRGPMVVISGQCERLRPVQLTRYHQIERSYGTFQRVVPILSPVNTREGSASLDNGVLTVRFPKVDERRGGKIPIDVRA